MTALYDHNHCGCDICLSDGDFTPEETLSIDNAVEKALKKIYSGNYKGEFPEEFWSITVDKLNDAVKTEFGNEFKPLANQLKYQNSVFAAFKAANQTQTLENLLTASKATTFTDFADSVRSTVKDYNYNHLKAEWKTAKMACRSAKRWAKAQEDADLFPNIEYLPSTAKDPRDVHKVYYGQVYAMDDPELSNIIPPKVWGCQCGWKTTDKPVTKFRSGRPQPDPGLDNNPGNDGALFSTSHPYIKSLKSAAKAILKSDIAAIHGIDEKDIVEFYHNPKTNGAFFSLDKLSKVEKVANKRIATIYADNGNLIELFDQNHIDSTVNGQWNEFKSPSNSANAFDQNLHKANKQLKSRGIVGDVTFELPANYDKGKVLNGLKDRANRSGFKSSIENIHFVAKGEYLGKCTLDDIKNGKVPF
jgi:hypothetical protein